MVATPSAAEFKTRYPEFTGVSDDLITTMFVEASSMVDDGWHEPDQKPALLALTAHLLSMEGYPARAALPAGSPIPASAGRVVLVRKVGDVTTQYAQTGSSMTSGSAGLLGSLALTVYGRRFAQLLKLNAPAIGVV